MILIFVLFVVNVVISAGDSSDETKYIDLLPDKEKDDFLETIARRIFNTVKSKDNRDRDSEDAAETQLDVQDEYIKKIIEDESFNLRKSDDIKKGDEDSHKIVKDEEPIELDINKQDNDMQLLKKEELDDDNHIDLTLREGKRNKRNISFEHEQPNENYKIIRISTGNLNEDINIPSKEESDREDIQIKHFKRIMPGILEDFDTTTQSSDSHNMTQMIDFAAAAGKYETEENAATSEDNQDTTTEDSVKSKESVTDHIIDENLSSTPKIYKSFESLNKSPELENNSTNTEPVTEVIEDTTISITEILNNDSTGVNVDRTKEIVSKENLTSVDIEKAVFTTDTDHTKVDVDEFVNKSVNILRSVAENTTVDDSPRAVYKIETERPFENTTNYEVVTSPILDLKYNSIITSENFLENSKNITEQTSVAFEYKNMNEIENVTVQVLVTDDDNNDTLTHSGTVDTPTSISNEISTERNQDRDATTLRTKILTKALLRTGTSDQLNQKENKTLQNNKTKINDTEVKDGIVRIELEKPNTIKVFVKNNANKGKVTFDNEIDHQSYYLANDMIKVLRQKLKPKTNLSEKNFNGLKVLYETTEPKEYKVYEVSPDKQPFIQKHRHENQENPVYVPVYDYSPKNAYFNPYNRFGAETDSKESLRTIINLDDINDREDNDENNDNNSHTGKRDRADYVASNELIKDDTQSLKSILKNLRIDGHENQRKFRFGFTKRIKKSQNSPYKLNLLPVVVNYPKYTDIYLNPNDYLDMDYYYGRTKNTDLRSRCEHSKVKKGKNKKRLLKKSKHRGKLDKGHLNDIEEEDSLKSHMRAVRMMLYRQKHFGRVPTTKVNFTGKVRKKESSESEEECSKETDHTNTNHIHTDHTHTGHTHPDHTHQEILRSKLESVVNSETTHSNKHIAMDYFFGRMSDDTDYLDARANNKLNHNNKNKLKKNREDPNNSFNPMVKNYNKKDYNNKYKSNQWNALYDILNKANMYDDLNKNYADSNYYNKRPKDYGNNFLNDEISPATPAYADVPISRAKKKKINYLDFNGVNKILNMTDAADLLPTLDKLLNVNRTMGKKKHHIRSDTVEDVEPYLTVLKRMFTNDSKASTQYDWLGTTVDVQAALSKMMDMTDTLIQKQRLSNLDLQLVKYLIFIHKSILHSDKDLLRKTKLLPRNKNKKKGFLKESGLYSRNWLYRKLVEASLSDETITRDDLNSFDDFLENVQYYLYDLHLAIQQIANITQYKNQNWFENLKQLYLDPKRKQLLEILLHVTVTRLLDLVEESAKQGLEDDFLTYVMKNQKEVERTKAELAFALEIIKELKKLDKMEFGNKSERKFK